MPAEDKKEKKERSQAAVAAKQMFVTVLLVLIVLFGIFSVVCAVKVLEVKKEAEAMLEGFDTSAFRSGETGFIYDADGELIASLKGNKDLYYMQIGDIPDIVKTTFLVAEDRNFYEHSGVDYTALLRAVYAIFKYNGKITQGGSTITQQLARMTFLTNETSMDRKLKEIFIAYKLEEMYTKDQIFEFYMNNIYFSNGLYGIEAAAQGYFSRSCKELSLSEVVFLCVIPNNPTKYDPYVGYENTLVRRDRILKQMLEEGEITKSQYDNAVDEIIALKPSQTQKCNYVETYVRNCATIELMKKEGFEIKTTFGSEEEEAAYDEEYSELYTECNMKLFTEGYVIYTSIDMDKQRELQSIVDTQLAKYTQTNDEGTYNLQAAATCIDNDTGYVVAIVGGRSQNNIAGYTLNRAYQSYRQPGSAIKPLIVYTPALERGYTANTTVADVKTDDGPTNVSPYYEGNITLRYAVEQSKNTVAWTMFQELTPVVGLSYIQAMNFKRIVEEDYNLASALGGLTYGVSTVEMAAGYSTIENDGEYRTTSCIVLITDSQGKIIVSGDEQQAKKQIYQKNACRRMTDILEGVLTRGSAIGYNVSNAICAAKTGTTDEDNDVWTVGYSTYYTTAVWLGYDYPKTLSNEIKQKVKGIWHDYMEKIHKGLEKVDFPEVDLSIKEEPITKETTTAAPVPETTTQYKDNNQLYIEETSINTNEPATGNDLYME